MTALDRIRERDARDCIAETLGLGRAAPIRNLPLPQSKTVVYETSAEIELVFSQPEVCYWLTTERCVAAPDDCHLGTCSRLVLRTPLMMERQTYWICARREPPEPGERPVTLEQAVQVRVGLDLVLDAEIVLDPSAGTRLLAPDRNGATDARITRFGAWVEVEVDDTQEGARYGLEAEPREAGGAGEPLSAAPDVDGLGPGKGPIRLRSHPLEEDRVLRIRATRRANDKDTGLAGVRLPIMVMADPARAVAPTPGPVIDWRGAASLVLEDGQRSVAYQVFARAIPDRDYRPHEAAPAEIEPIEIPNRESLPVRVPARPAAPDWQTPAGFEPIAELVAQQDGRLEIPLPSQETDRVLLVRAQKMHQRQGGRPSVPSAVRLETPVVLLMRPDPAPSLRLALDLDTNEIEVEGGTPGVLYYLRPGPDADELPDAAYMHQRDPADAGRNKGIGALAVRVDLVVIRDRPDGGAMQDAAITPPLPPRIDAGSHDWRRGGELHLRAVKAQTGLDQPLSHVAVVSPTGQVRPDEQEVDRGAATSIRVFASDPADRYRLTRNGETIAEPQPGNGVELALPTGPIQDDTRFELHIERREPQGIPVVRLLSFTIQVRIAS